MKHSYMPGAILIRRVEIKWVDSGEGLRIMGPNRLFLIGW